MKKAEAGDEDGRNYPKRSVEDGERKVTEIWQPHIGPTTGANEYFYRIPKQSTMICHVRAWRSLVGKHSATP